MKWLGTVVCLGACSLPMVRAQEGTLAPTSPVVPAPVVQDGKLLNSMGGNSPPGSSMAARWPALGKWLPLRTSANAGAAEPAVTVAAGPSVPMSSLSPLPAQPVAGCASGNCAPAGASAGHGRHTFDGHCWRRFKNWLCFHYQDTGLPRCKPMYYVGPLQGMFPCSSPNCGYGCANGNCAAGQPLSGPPGAYPLGQPNPVQSLPAPQPAPAGTGAGAVSMPPRGTQGSANTSPLVSTGNVAGPVMMPSRGTQGTPLAPTWQGRTAVTAASGRTQTSTSTSPAGYRYASPYGVGVFTSASPSSYGPYTTTSTPTMTNPGTIVNTGGWNVLQK